MEYTNNTVLWKQVINHNYVQFNTNDGYTSLFQTQYHKSIITTGINDSIF